MKLLYLFLSSSVLIGAVLLIRRFFRKLLAPGVAFALWMLPLLRLMLPFGLGELSISDGKAAQTLTYPYALVQETVEQAEEVRIRKREALPEKELVKIYDEVPQKEKEIPWVYVLWFAGSMGTLGLVIYKNRKIQRRIGKVQIVEIREGIPICTGKHVKYSCLAGILKPRILLPLTVWEDPEAYECAITHEIAHYQRKDPWWNGIRILCCVAYWWHPLVWLGAMAAKEDAELACDARVLRSADEKERRNYGYALLKLLTLEQNREESLWMAASFLGGKKTMTKRIEEITRKTKTRKCALIPITAILVFLLVTGCVSLKEDQWLCRTSFDQSWDEDGVSYLEMEYEYETDNRIQSKLLYYEVYEYGELTDRHVAAYGAVEHDGKQNLKLCLKSDAEAQSLLLTENENAQTNIPIRNGAYCYGTRGGSSDYSDTKTEFETGKELLLYEEMQGESTGSENLEDMTERQIAEQTKDIERTLLIRLVFSELSEEELYETYQNREVSQ